MSEFVNVAHTGEIAPGQMKAVEITGLIVVVVNLDGDYYAFQARCPHRDGPLDQGYLWGECIECPWHHFRYDIRTGENVYPKNVYPNIQKLQQDLKPLRLWEVNVDGQEVKVKLP